MDDEFRELETELRRLRPAVPAREFRMRIEHKLVRVRRATVLRFAGLALPLAAAAAGMLLFQSKSAPTTKPVAAASAAAAQPATLFKPVAAQNILLDSRDEGYVTLGDGRTARRLRQTYVDRITWKNPRTNASLTWSVPREEVRVTPVSYE